MRLVNDLRERQQNGQPVRVAVIGAGFFGRGVIRQLRQLPGIEIAIVANRTIANALEALAQAGVPRTSIRECRNPRDAQAVGQNGGVAVTSMLELPFELAKVDVVVETTGNITVGTESAWRSLEAGKHFVSANPETQATVGCILQREAVKRGVVYSDVDGDQPGILKRLYDRVAAMGFEPVIAGNCKGVMKRYATPETQKEYCRQNPIKPWIATAAADGTKLNIEMCLVANATGMLPAQTGMTGLQTSLDSLMKDLTEAGLLQKGPIVEYTLGIPSGIFVVGRQDNPAIASEMAYLKMGNGPFYLFYEPHVLCHYETVFSIAEAGLYGEATIAPRPSPVADVVMYAKRDLPQGAHLDGLGGYDGYGLIAAHEEVTKKNLVPAGLTEFMRLGRKIAKDEPICWDDIDHCEENFVTRMWFRQQEILKYEAHLHQSRDRKNVAVPLPTR